MAKLTLKRSEASVKAAVQQLLKARGIMSFRMNAGDRLMERNGKKWRIMGHPAGTADILALIYFFEKFEIYEVPIIMPLWIECKSSSGKQSTEQKQFQQMVEREGHSYLLARSAEEVAKWLEENA